MFALASSARADSSESPGVARPAFDTGDVRWRESFRRVDWREYLITPTLLLGALATQALPEPTEPRWRGPVLNVFRFHGHFRLNADDRLKQSFQRAQWPKRM